MMYGSEKSPPGWRQVGRHGRDGQLGLVGTRRVGEFDCDGFRRALRYCAVQLFDGHLRLHALVKPDEADPFGKTCHKDDTH